MKLYTVDEAWQWTRIRPTTWRRWILLGKISVVHLGRAVRIPENEILRLIQAGTTPARGPRQ